MLHAVALPDTPPTHKGRSMASTGRRTTLPGPPQVEDIDSDARSTRPATELEEADVERRAAVACPQANRPAPPGGRRANSDSSVVATRRSKSRFPNSNHSELLGYGKAYPFGPESQAC